MTPEVIAQIKLDILRIASNFPETIHSSEKVIDLYKKLCNEVLGNG